MTAAGTDGADGRGRCPTGADQHDELFRSGDGGVEQVALQHHPCADSASSRIESRPGGEKNSVLATELGWISRTTTPGG